jgi:hypothetical protein
MIPQIPQLDPLPLPAPGWLLWSLLTLTFVLHVVAMNLLLGGAILAALCRSRSRRCDNARKLALLLPRALPTLVATTVTFGVAALLFLQVLYGRLFFTSAVLLAVPWLLVVPILVAAYYGAYGWLSRIRTDRQASTGGAWGLALAFMATAFIYANVMGLMLRPHEFLARAQADATGFHLALSDPTVLPRFLHVIAGSLALAGLAVAWWGVSIRRRDRSLASWMTAHGVYWAAGATIFNFLPGFWWLAALPREAILGLLGQNPAATAFFAVGIIAALAGLGLLVPAAFAPDPRRILAGASASLLVSVVLMVLVRDAVRAMTLAPTGYRLTTWIEPQWGPIAVFIVLLVSSLGLVVWMVYKLVAVSGPAAARGHEEVAGHGS